MTQDWFSSARETEHEAPDTPGSLPSRLERLPTGVRLSTDRNAPPPTDARGEQWVPIGPSVTMFGGVADRPRIAGRVHSLKVSPDGGRAYAGTANGGVWFTPDAGQSWRALDFYVSTRDAAGALQEASALSIGALHVDFDMATDGSADTVFVGTGESNPSRSQNTPTSQLAGVGVRVATNPAGAVATNPASDLWRLEGTNLAGAAIRRLVRFRHSADHASTTVWAATSAGLYRRPASGAAADWDRVVETPCWDIVVATSTTGATQLFAAHDDGQLRVRQTADGDEWTDIALTDFPALVAPLGREPLGRMVLAAGTAATPVVYALSTGGRMWRISAGASAQVTGVPINLFGFYDITQANPSSSASYCMAMAVNPSNPADVMIAGSSAYDGDHASLYRATITGPPYVFPLGAGVPYPNSGAIVSPPVAAFVGRGVHPDVHDLAWVAPPGAPQPHLWVGCDGGVYRSTTSGAAGSWVARNSGLSIIECTFLAQHPTSEGILLLGTQDNGVSTAMSPETWLLVAMGDGGGVAIDPADPRRLIGQYIHNQWRRSLDGLTFQNVSLFAAPPGAPAATVALYTTATTADASCSFYSGAAVIRPPGGPTQLAIGTRRVWFSEDWGTTWRTLPSWQNPNTPLPGATGPQSNLDLLAGNESVIQLRWFDADNLLVLTSKRVLRMVRTANITSTTPGGVTTNSQTWVRHVLYDPSTAPKKEKDYDGIIPPYMPLTDVVGHQGHAPHPTLYVTTGRSERSAEEHHVWWFDGTNRWVDAGLTFNGPAYAVIVDPRSDSNETVYVGTSVGVWKGTFHAPAPGQRDPTWTWQHYSDGLPEAPVADLQIHEETGLLRAALAGRGVWEMKLTRIVLGFGQGREAFVRAHAYDRRRRDVPVDPRDPYPALGTTEPYAAAAYPALRLDASPDVRVRRAPGSPQAPIPPFSSAPPGTYTPAFNGTTRDFDVFAIESAIRRTRADTPVMGLADADHWFAVQRFGGGVASISPAAWTALTGGANGNIYPFSRVDAAGAPIPDHADANVLYLDEPFRTPPPHPASCTTGSGPVCVDVVVHGRDWRSIAANRVSVALLRVANPASLAPGTAPTLPAGWATRLAADRATPPAPGSVPAWLGAAWRYVDDAHPIRSLPGPLTAAEAQVVTFEADLSAPGWPASGWLLVAIVLADDDPIDGPIIAITDVGRLVRESRHFALRSVR